MWFLLALYVFGTLDTLRPREANGASAGPRFTPTLLASPPSGRRLFLFGCSLAAQVFAIVLLVFALGAEPPRPPFRPDPRHVARLFVLRTWPGEAARVGLRAPVRAFGLAPALHAARVRQTLLQPDLPPDLKPEIRIPDLLLWMPSVRDVAAEARPIPDPSRSLTAPPSLEQPNRELTAAALPLSVSLAMEARLSIPAATTSPVSLAGPASVRLLAQTELRDAARTSAEPVLSVPDLPLLARRVVVVPPANQAAAPGFGGKSGEAGSNARDLAPDSRLYTRLTFPRDGSFPVVVFGSPAADVYPGSEGLLGGKLVYTVYLKVGLPKSWILQYCLSGGAGSIAAPWPFVRVRPNVPMATDVGYVIVRGSVDAEGRFEHAALIAPARLNGSDALLAALKQWEFRPAMEDGRQVAVEVLLIIPPAAEEEN